MGFNSSFKGLIFRRIHKIAKDNIHFVMSVRLVAWSNWAPNWAPNRRIFMKLDF